MMRSVQIAIFLIIFGAVCGMFNASGIFDMHLTTGTTEGFSEAMVTQFTDGAADAAVNPFGVLNQIFPLVASVLSGIVQALTIAPLLIAYGVPTWIAIPLSLPIWFIYGVDLLNWVVKR